LQISATTAYFKEAKINILTIFIVNLPTVWSENCSPKKLGEGYFSGHTLGTTLDKFSFIF
jgi:hypothetical protein